MRENQTVIPVLCLVNVNRKIIRGFELRRNKRLFAFSKFSRPKRGREKSGDEKVQRYFTEMARKGFGLAVFLKSLRFAFFQLANLHFSVFGVGVLGANAVIGIRAHGRADVDFFVDVFNLAVVKLWRLLVLHVHRAARRKTDGRKRRHEGRVSVSLVRDDAAEWVRQIGDSESGGSLAWLELRGDSAGGDAIGNHGG